MKRWTLLFATAFFFGLPTFGQSTGQPPFGSFESGGFDTINRANLNANFAISIMANPGRGQGMSFSIVYDSLVWQKTTGTPVAWTPVVDESGSPTWGWKRDPKGKTTYKVTLGRLLNCGGYSDYELIYSTFAYTDMAGTRHGFNILRKYNPCTDTFYCCTSTGYATDKSGYKIDATIPYAALVRNPHGEDIPASETVTDTNGNYISKTTISSTETHWKDTLGRVVLKVIKKTGAANCPAIGGGSFPECYEYIYWSADGVERKAKLFLNTFNVKTNFACSGVNEYNQSGKLLPSKLELANGQSHGFTYEPTPLDATKTTGRLKRITLPTGGYYEYRYPSAVPSTDHNGINCTNATIVDLTRAINESPSGTERVWKFVRTQVGSDWKTRVTPPALSYDGTVAHESTFTFNVNGALLTTKQYSGSEATGTLWRTVNTTWAANGTPAGQVVILEDTPGASKLQSKSETIFDDHGNLKELKEYDYGFGVPPTTHVRKTTLTYLHESVTAYLTRNIINRVKSVRLDDSAGNKKAETLIEYDQTALTTVASVPHHDYTNYPATMLYRGNPTQVKRWLTGSIHLTTTNVYDELGNLRTVTDPKSYSTTITYTDSWHDSSCPPSAGSFAYPTEITNHLGHRTRLKYYACTGQPREIQDENDIANSRPGTRMAYADSLRRMTQTDFADNGRITVTYTDAFNQVTTAQKRTATEWISVTDLFNGLGQLRQRQLPANRKVDVEFDELGGQWKVYNPYVNISDPTYGYVETRIDALGRVKLVRKQDGVEDKIEYAANATKFRTRTKVSPETYVDKITEVDALGRLKKVCEATAGNTLSPAANCSIAGFSSVSGYLTSYSYNERDDLTTINQGSQTRTFTHDNLSRVTAAIVLEVSTSSSVEYQYDDNGNRTSVKDPRNRVCFEYDELNRLRKKRHAQTTDTCPAGTVVAEFVYDGPAASNSLGRLRTEWDGASGAADRTEYSYDTVGRLLVQSRTISSATYAMALGYDLMGNAITLDYPSASGTRRKVEYTFKTTGEAEKVRDVTSTAFDYVTGTTYSNLGTIEQINFQNSVQTLLGWNQRGMLTSVHTRKDLGGSYQSHFNLSYQYYANGQVSAILNQLVAGNVKDEEFTYDELLRLAIAQRGPDTSIQRKYEYEYDRYGNRWKQNWVAGSYGLDVERSFNSANNRITDPAAYAYDQSGNVTANAMYTGFAYDAENFNITAPNSSTYKVDAQGRRVRKTVSGTVTDYFYLGPEVIAEKTGANWKDYIFFAGQRIAEQTGSTSTTATFLHTDHLGSTRLCTNSSGGNAGTCDYEPFGEVQPGTTCGVPTKFRFAGMEWDDESQLYHTWFRQYDPVQGRWMGPDPLPGSLDDPQSLNRYVYVRNDPGNLVDPLGLEWFCAEWWGSFWVGEDGSLTFIEGSEFCGGGWIWFSEGGGGGGGGEEQGGGGGSPRDLVLEARDVVLKILGGSNPCAGFFAGSPVLAGMNTGSDYFKLLDSFGVDDEYLAGELMGPADVFEGVGFYARRTTGTTGADTQQGAGARGNIFYNLNGWFFNSTVRDSQGNLVTPRIGGYAGNTLGIRVLGILHEHAHNVGLIPSDQGNRGQSIANTDTILDHCLSTVISMLGRP